MGVLSLNSKNYLWNLQYTVASIQIWKSIKFDWNAEFISRNDKQYRRIVKRIKWVNDIAQFVITVQRWEHNVYYLVLL